MLHVARRLCPAILLLCTGPSISRGQAVQATRGVNNLVARAEQAAIATFIESSGSTLISARLQVLGDTSRKPDERLYWQGELTRIADKASEALSAREAPAMFRARYAEYRMMYRGVVDPAAGPQTEALRTQLQKKQLVDAKNIPQLPTRFPDISFTVDYELQWQSGVDAVHIVGLSTSLLGDAAGTAFDAVGSDKLKDYAVNNVSAGTTLASDGSDRIGAAVGLGIGELKWKSVFLWPVLSVEQMDRKDSRAPKDLVQSHPDVKNWSAPALAIGIACGDIAKLKKAIEAGKLVPVYTVAIGWPHYFPGDAFTALGAVFSDRRSDFERAGDVRLSLGVSFPLKWVKREST